MEDTILGALALQNIRGLGPAKIKRALSGPLLTSALADIVAVAERLGVRISSETAQHAVDAARVTLDTCARSGIAAIVLGSPTYPSLLAVLKDPPPVLYVRGVLPSRAVAVIGTRAPSPVGTTIAERLGAYLSDHGWAVCNGLADGIDAASVDGRAVQNGCVLGVLAGGLDIGSSKTTSKAVAARAERTLYGGGALVSEVGPGIRENTFSIVKSCRLQAGLTRGTVLVESALDGGSRFAVEALAPLGRPLGIVAISPGRESGESSGMNAALLSGESSHSPWTEKLCSRAAEAWPIVALSSKTDYAPFLDRLEGGGSPWQASLFAP